jgi:acetyltransferase-like isoleucine patch superfamily enzyme
MRDVKAAAMRRLDGGVWTVVRSASGLASRADAWARGVELERDCVFVGRAHFSRAAYSRIVIGPGCEFRSTTWANEVGVNRPCRLSTLRAGAEVRLGAGCGLSGTIIAAARSVRLGDRVLCGANVTITDSDAHGIAIDARRSPPEPLPVVIEDDVWLGLNVVVLKGVTIGRGSVVAAGSIVVRDLPAGVVAAGQPAVVVGTTSAQSGPKRPGAPGT